MGSHDYPGYEPHDQRGANSASRFNGESDSVLISELPPSVASVKHQTLVLTYRWRPRFKPFPETGNHRSLRELRRIPYLQAPRRLTARERAAALERTPTPVGARDLSAGSLDDRLHLVVIEGAEGGRPDVALCCKLKHHGRDALVVRGFDY